jgi:hypothetical protein
MVAIRNGVWTQKHSPDLYVVDNHGQHSYHMTHAIWGRLPIRVVNRMKAEGPVYVGRNVVWITR